MCACAVPVCVLCVCLWVGVGVLVGVGGCSGVGGCLCGCVSAYMRMCAGAFAGLVTQPMDCLKTRLQVCERSAPPFSCSVK